MWVGWKKIVCLIGLVSIPIWGFVQNPPVIPPLVAEFRIHVVENDRTKLLQSLFDLADQKPAIEQLIPELTGLVRTGQDSVMRDAVRCLTKAGAAAAPATSALIGRLDNNDYIVRAELSRALIAIGAEAVPLLEAELKSSSPIVRSAVISIITKITAVPIEHVLRFQNDPAIGVRVAVAEAWKKHGSEGVGKIVELLKDPEPVVAIAAARALRFHFADTSLAVPGLIDSLSRKDVGWMSAQTLQSYGVDAQAAIPALIANFPLGAAEGYSREDVVTDALAHIGPARLDDLDLLVHSLSDPNPEVQSLAAREIGKFGLAGGKALEILKTLFEVSIVASKEIGNQADAIEIEGARETFLKESPYYGAAADAACIAIWRISHDTELLVAMIRQMVELHESEVDFYDDSPFPEFAEADVSYLFPLLDNEETPLKLSGAHAMRRIPGKFISLEMLSKVRLQDDDTKFIYSEIVGKLGKQIGESLSSWLVDDYLEDRLTLSEFADCVKRLKVKGRNVVQVLENGLVSGDKYGRRDALIALAAIAKNADEAAQLVVDKSRNDKTLRGPALDALWNPPGSSDILLPFAIECLDDADREDYSLKPQAITVLARLGPDAIPSVPKIRKVLADEKTNVWTRFRCAIAIWTIADDRRELDRLLDLAIHDNSEDSNQSRSIIFGELTAIGSKADELFGRVLEMIKSDEANRDSTFDGNRYSLKLLGTIRSARAIEQLKNYSNHRDWQTRIMAIDILKAIEKGEEYVEDDNY